MVALAIPILEGAASALLNMVVRATATAGAGAILTDEVQKRAQSASASKDKAVAKTATTTVNRKPCDKCPPDGGTIYPRKTAGWSPLSIEYQQRIGAMPTAPSGFINEWSFNGVRFDGFDSSQCLLKEAKGRYDQFFNEFRQIYPWWRDGEFSIREEAMRQGGAALPRPPIQLRWYFMEPISYRYFSRIITAAYPDIEVVFLP